MLFSFAVVVYVSGALAMLWVCRKLDAMAVDSVEDDTDEYRDPLVA
jgi:hypothetical protein